MRTPDDQQYAKLNIEDGKEKSDAVEEEQEEEEEKKAMACALWVILALLLLAAVDGFTTHFFKRFLDALGNWTIHNAPGSFFVFHLVIIIFILACLPYGPLGALSGALFVERYGSPGGVVLAWLALFASTTAAAIVCFALARHRFRNSVQRMIDKNPKLAVLKKLDRLMETGQGIEMTVLVRLAPLPKGPVIYFLGTTSVGFNEFLTGSTLVNLPMCFLDVCVGASAKNLNKDSPLSMAVFASALGLSLLAVCVVGARAKAKLQALEAEDAAQAEAEEALSIMAETGLEEEENEAAEGGGGGERGGGKGEGERQGRDKGQGSGLSGSREESQRRKGGGEDAVVPKEAAADEKENSAEAGPSPPLEKEAVEKGASKLGSAKATAAAR